MNEVQAEYRPLKLTPLEFQQIAQSMAIDEIDSNTGAPTAAGRTPSLTVIVKMAQHLGFRIENGLIVDVPPQVEIAEAKHAR